MIDVPQDLRAMWVVVEYTYYGICLLFRSFQSLIFIQVMYITIATWSIDWFSRCKDDVHHREFKKQCNAACVGYNDNMNVLVVLVSVPPFWPQAAQAIYLYLYLASCGFLLAFSKWQRRKERRYESHSRPLKKNFLCHALYLHNIFFANYCTSFWINWIF